MIQGLSDAQRVELVELAARLLQTLPQEGFGGFARSKLSAFICVANPKSKAGELARRVIVSTAEPSSTEILCFMGREYVLEAFRELPETGKPMKALFVASLIDALRTRFSESLNEIEGELQRLVKSRNLEVSLAARAALARKGAIQGRDFARFLLRKLALDKKGIAVAWLIRNPEFVPQIHELPPRVWTAILDAFAAKRPELALQLVERSFSELEARDTYQYLDESFKALARIPGSESQTIFSGFVVRLVNKEKNELIGDLFAREPARSLLRGQLWTVVNQARGEKAWNLFFGTVTAGMAEAALVRMIEDGTKKDSDLRAWLLGVFAPRLLQEGRLSPAFWRLMGDPDLLVALARQLAQQTLTNVQYLRGFSKEWAEARETMKEAIFLKIQVGLRVAILNCQANKTLSSRLTRLSSAADEWKSNDSPKMDPTIAAVSAIRLPKEQPASEQALEEFFRQQVNSPHDAALFVGSNPWAADILFGGKHGAWPKPELLLEQICKSFLFVATVKQRAAEGLRQIPHAIKVELAIALREYTSEIEAELAGYFTFRSLLGEIGLHTVTPDLGEGIKPEQLSSERHKLIKDPERQGRLRIFGLGIRVDDQVVGAVTITKSGDKDDRD